MRKISEALFEIIKRFIIPWALLEIFSDVTGMSATFSAHMAANSSQKYAVLIVYVLFVLAWYQACWRVWDVVKHKFRR